MSTIVPGMVGTIHFGEGAFVEKGAVILELESRTEELDIERREVMVDTLKASFERSEMLLKNTSSISMEEVDEARSEYQLALIELELARDALSKKQTVAPFSGVLTDLIMDVGEYCEPPQPVLRLVDTRQFYCEANVNPVAAARLKVDDPVVFTSEGGAGANRIPGTIMFVSPVLDPASGLLRIKAIFPNPEGKIRPGEGGFLEINPES
jgi:membrane fusion protein (multidrug efflux system)